jgi:hypothetical protein
MVVFVPLCGWTEAHPKATELIFRAYTGVRGITRENVDPSAHYLDRVAHRGITKSHVLDTIETGHPFVDLAANIKIPSHANPREQLTGLVYLKEKSPILSPGVIMVPVDPKTRKIATVIEYAGQTVSDVKNKLIPEDYAKWLDEIEKGSALRTQRFHPLPNQKAIIDYEGRLRKP